MPKFSLFLNKFYLLSDNVKSDSTAPSMQNDMVTTEMDCEESITSQVPNKTQQQTEPEENPSKPSQSEQVPIQDDTIHELPVEHKKKIVEIVIGTSGDESSASKASKKQQEGQSPLCRAVQFLGLYLF